MTFQAKPFFFTISYHIGPFLLITLLSFLFSAFAQLTLLNDRHGTAFFYLFFYSEVCDAACRPVRLRMDDGDDQEL